MWPSRRSPTPSSWATPRVCSGALHHALTSGDRVAMRVEERGDASALVITLPQADLARRAQAPGLGRRHRRERRDAPARVREDRRLRPALPSILGPRRRAHRSDAAPVSSGDAQGVVRPRSHRARRRRIRPARRARVGARGPRVPTPGAHHDAPAPAAPRGGVAPDGEPARGAEQVRRSPRPERSSGPSCAAGRGRSSSATTAQSAASTPWPTSDALITLGDPWPHLGDARNDAAFLGLAQAWQQRLEAMCRAELEQAHGRIRPVHRARPGRALHVGTVLPSGYGWTSGSVEMRAMPRGPRAVTRARVGATSSERSSSASAASRVAARRLGCSPSTRARATAPATAPRAAGACSRRSKCSRFPIGRG